MLSCKLHNKFFNIQINFARIHAFQRYTMQKESESSCYKIIISLVSTKIFDHLMWSQICAFLALVIGGKHTKAAVDLIFY